MTATLPASQTLFKPDFARLQTVTAHDLSANVGTQLPHPDPYRDPRYSIFTLKTSAPQGTILSPDGPGAFSLGRINPDEFDFDLFPRTFTFEWVSPLNVQIDETAASRTLFDHADSMIRHEGWTHKERFPEM